MAVFLYEMRNADHTNSHTSNDFRQNENELETQLKLVLGRTYKYHIPSDASICRLMPTKDLN
jgi:hypothetical protein